MRADDENIGGSKQCAFTNHLYILIEFLQFPERSLKAHRKKILNFRISNCKSIMNYRIDL